jgi:Secretion system C-terminal sorting domain
MRKYLLVILVSIAFVTQGFAVTKTSTGTNWATSSNWSPAGVPANGDDVIINTAMSIPNGTTTNVVRTVTINSGRSLAVNGNATLFFSNTITVNGTLNLNGTSTVSGGNGNNGTISVAGTLNLNAVGTTISISTLTNSGNMSINGTLTLYGDLTNTGTFNYNTGSLVLMSGSALQTIFGTLSVGDITVSTGSQVTLANSANVTLNGTLTLNASSSFDADGPGGGGTFTIASIGDNLTSDGAIATIPGTATFSGNVNVQRFMSLVGPNLARIYRYISSPVQNGTALQIQNTIPITGSFTGNSNGCSGCLTNQSMFAYDESVAGTLNVGFVNFPAASNTETLQTGKGYALYVRGNIINPDGTWTVNGPINSGSVNYNISFTANSGVADDGWNLIGNPYPSTIDWDSPGWNSTNVGNTMYYIDNVSQTVATYTRGGGGVGTNGGTNHIAMGQGFYVQASATGSLTSNETVKVGGTQTTFFRQQGAPENSLHISLSQGTRSDEVIVRFLDGATDKLDPNIDAFKFKNRNSDGTAFLNLSTLTHDNYKMVVNSLAPLANLPSPKSIALDVADVSQGTYQLNFSNLDSFSPSVSITLLDKFTDAKQDVRTKTSYSFSVDPANTSTFGSGRFVLIFDGPFVVTGLESNGFEGSVSVFPNPTSGSIGIEITSSAVSTAEVLNNLGQRIGAVGLVNDGLTYKGSYDLSSNSNGLYFVRIIDERTGTQTVKKVIKN